MDPATLSLIMLGLNVGSQAIQAFVANRQAMTPEQIALVQPLVERISAAQAMVTPYEKEKP